MSESIFEGIVPTLFLCMDPLNGKIPLHNHFNLFVAEYVSENQEILQEINKVDITRFNQKELLDKLGDDFKIFLENKYITVDKLSDLLDKHKIEVGSHTRSHINLNIEDFNVLNDQVKEAHKDLESLLNRKIDYFSFPFGKIDKMNYKSEYLAMEVSEHYFSCFGGINQNHIPGSLLRISIHNESVDELRRLLLYQHVR